MLLSVYYTEFAVLYSADGGLHVTVDDQLLVLVRYLSNPVAIEPFMTESRVLVGVLSKHGIYPSS
jgi:hypothetical protein